jgi:cytochrome c-type protein NapB
MKIKLLLMSAVLAFTGNVLAAAIDEMNMGLGDDAVFSNPTPSAYDYVGSRPGKNDRIDPAYDTLPPTIPHTIDRYLPITANDNQCMDCHDWYNRIGRKYVKGKKKLPMPKSHYGGFGGKGVKDQMSGARYTCVQCHVPATDAKPLVSNTF